MIDLTLMRGLGADKCHISCDHVPIRSWSLLKARHLMRAATLALISLFMVSASAKQKCVLFNALDTANSRIANIVPSPFGISWGILTQTEPDQFVCVDDPPAVSRQDIIGTWLLRTKFVGAGKDSYPYIVSDFREDGDVIVSHFRSYESFLMDAPENIKILVWELYEKESISYLTMGDKSGSTAHVIIGHNGNYREMYRLFSRDKYIESKLDFGACLRLSDQLAATKFKLSSHEYNPLVWQLANYRFMDMWANTIVGSYAQFIEKERIRLSTLSQKLKRWVELRRGACMISEVSGPAAALLPAPQIVAVEKASKSFCSAFEAVDYILKYVGQNPISEERPNDLPSMRSSQFDDENSWWLSDDMLPELVSLTTSYFPIGKNKLPEGIQATLSDEVRAAFGDEQTLKRIKYGVNKIRKSINYTGGDDESRSSFIDDPLRPPEVSQKLLDDIQRHLRQQSATLDRTRNEANNLSESLEYASAMIMQSPEYKRAIRYNANLVAAIAEISTQLNEGYCEAFDSAWAAHNNSERQRGEICARHLFEDVSRWRDPFDHNIVRSRNEVYYYGCRPASRRPPPDRAVGAEPNLGLPHFVLSHP